MPSSRERAFAFAFRNVRLSTSFARSRFHACRGSMLLAIEAWERLCALAGV